MVWERTFYRSASLKMNVHLMATLLECIPSRRVKRWMKLTVGHGIVWGILAAGVVAACVIWPAHQNMYSTSIYAGGVSYRPILNIGWQPNALTIEETRRYITKEGLTIMDLGHETERGGMLWVTTRVSFGQHSRDFSCDSSTLGTRAGAIAVSIIGVLAIPLLLARRRWSA
jgi:hypothetical protein